MSLPISQQQCLKASAWLKQNFEVQIKECIQNTPWTVELVCAIFCQETASKLLLWMDHYSAETILQRCVFDASGDFPGTHRSAFPRNAKEFQQTYGLSITTMLINQANMQRAMPQHDAPKGYSAADYLYKGYGIFQYDLQNIKKDPEFFLFKKWYNFSDCILKLVEELDVKARRQTILRDIVQAYNGAGKAAEIYADNVMTFKGWVEES